MIWCRLCVNSLQRSIARQNKWLLPDALTRAREPSRYAKKLAP